MKDIMINERYRVDYKIGEGGYGLVYAGTDTESNEEVAIKLSSTQTDFGMILRNEADTYEALSGGVGVPQVRWFGTECEYAVLIQDLLGPSLEDLLNYCGRKLSLKTILLLADQAISRIEYIHSKGLLHCDIKPENLLMGSGRKGNVLHTIDFGVSKEFCGAERDPNLKRAFACGTTLYASINNQNMLQLSWRDDLESLGYVLVYLSSGDLPWLRVKLAAGEEINEAIKQKKMTLPVEQLCEGLPSEFVKYIDYTRSLGYAEKPNYAYLRQLFRRRFALEGFKYDNVYDWTAKLFHEMQQ